MAVPIKMMACVEEIIPYTSDVFQVTFNPDNPLPPCRAGQFLSLSLDNYDPCGGRWPESRAFSLTSSTRKNKIVIVYSVRGVFTKRMRDELCIGKRVWVSLPLGANIVNAHETTHDVVLVAGGTGIAPYIPYLEEELENPSGRKILLAYGIRGEHLYLFKQLLQDCCQRLPTFELLLFSGKDIDFARIYKKTESMNNSRFFISGPPGMTKALQDFLSVRDVQEDRIHVDNWG